MVGVQAKNKENKKQPKKKKEKRHMLAIRGLDTTSLTFTRTAEPHKHLSGGDWSECVCV